MEKEHKTSGMATASFVLGLVSLPLGWIPFFGQILMILAIVFGFVALNNIKKNKNLGGKSLATWGIILGFLWLIIIIIFVAIGVGWVVVRNVISGSAVQSLDDINYTENLDDNQEIPTLQEPKSWHDAYYFQGENDKNTDTFSIKGNKFRLRYNINPANDFSLFYLYVYEEGNNLFVDSFSLYEGSDSSIVYDGPGTYYLKIGSANLNSWEVEVDDYY